MATPPKNIRSVRADELLEFHWPDGSCDRLSYRLLREACPCAACVDEMTGRRILDISTIPDDIHPADIAFTGNYALKITWSDGHSTGLYTWDHLARLGQQRKSALP